MDPTVSESNEHNQQNLDSLYGQVAATNGRGKEIFFTYGLT